MAWSDENGSWDWNVIRTSINGILVSIIEGKDHFDKYVRLPDHVWNRMKPKTVTELF